MRLTSYQYSPLGYRSPCKDDLKRGTEADKLISESYGIASAGLSKCTSWEFRRKVINRALDRFGYLRDWIKAQDGNERMSKHMRELLIDTMIFIRTGRRPMSIQNRVDLIRLETKKDNTRGVYKNHSRDIFNALAMPTEDYMYYWLQHENGFNDMLCTINVIFGDIDTRTSAAS